MAKQVIVLERSENTQAYRIAYWLAVPASRQSFYANPTATSVWSGASAGELSAIRTGAVVEAVETNDFAGMTLPAIQTELQSEWSALQADVTARNPWVRYGSFWDGATWTPGGVA